MSGKDESVFSKSALMSTKPGKQIMKQGLFKSKGYKQFNQLANKNTFCVIGRPIYAYGDPKENIKNIINS